MANVTDVVEATARESNERAIDLELDDVAVSLIGQPGAWLTAERYGETVTVTPSRPLPRRCTIRVAALFRHDRDFPSISTVMGRLVFMRGATDGQVYRPFTRDPERHLHELFFPVEAMPDDDWWTSPERWSNYQAIAKRLLNAGDVSWRGLSKRDVSELVDFVPYPEPLEGCLLYALAQWTHEQGQCVIEIGSLQGRSMSMLAMALRGVESDSLLFSVDPHSEHPHNPEHVRLALRQIGEEARLVQIRRPSDEASRVLGRQVASMVFIDGDHSYEQVLGDFMNYRDVLAPGGCLVFHDYGFGRHNGLPDLHPGIGRVVDEHVMADPEFRPLLLGHTLFAFVKKGPEARQPGCRNERLT